jgi:TonB family protein
MSHRTSLLRWLCLLTALLLTPATAFAQAANPANQGMDVLSPIYVTARLFQITAPKGGVYDVTDQVFRMKTASLPDEEKWLSTFQKTYPGFTAALLQTNNLRVFRTAKPGIITFGQWSGRTMQVYLNAAQSYGDGVTPGTQLISDIGVHFGNDRTSPPITLSLMPLDIESGLTYFFALPQTKLNSKDYANFIRQGAPEAAFTTQEVILVFAYSVELNRPAPGPRQWNEQQSAALLKEAQKKVQPELTVALKQAGLGGKIQVRVEINPNGKVVRALTHSSTLPEMNGEAVAAARQWEFSPALFADSKDPISGLLTFEFAAAPKPAELKQ